MKRKHWGLLFAALLYSKHASATGLIEIPTLWTYQICLQKRTNKYIVLSPDEVRQICTRRNRACVAERISSMFDPRLSRRRYLFDFDRTTIVGDMLMVSSKRQADADLEVLPAEGDYVRIKLIEPKLGNEVICYYDKSFGGLKHEQARSTYALAHGFWRSDEVASLMEPALGVRLNGSFVKKSCMHHMVGNLVAEFLWLEQLASEMGKDVAEVYQFLDSLVTQGWKEVVRISREQDICSIDFLCSKQGPSFAQIICRIHGNHLDHRFVTATNLLELSVSLLQPNSGDISIERCLFGMHTYEGLISGKRLTLDNLLQLTQIFECDSASRVKMVDIIYQYLVKSPECVDWSVFSE